MSKHIFIAAGLFLATAMVASACSLWSWSYPSPGERSFDAARIWSPRCGAIAFVAGAHAILAWVSLPRLYRPRPVYLGAAACTGGLGVLSLVSAVALLLACR